jgi:hypothetical protein
MKLILTHYIDAAPETVMARLGAAVSAGLDAAASRAAMHRSDTVTTTLDDGIRIDGGLDALTGTDCTFTGSDNLTELRVEVPWSPSDSGTTKLWAANRFAGVLAEQLTANMLTADQLAAA